MKAENGVNSDAELDRQVGSWITHSKACIGLCQDENNTTWNTAFPSQTLVPRGILWCNVGRILISRY